MIPKKIYNNPVCLVDIGASGGIHSRWARFKNIHVLGFEPDDRAFANLPSDKRFTWFNTALYSEKGSFPLYITNASTNTSMLKPNLGLIENLAYDAGGFDIISSTEISCDTLDSICRENDIAPDVIKIDTQGTELLILEGATEYLNKSIFAVESEIEFLPLYEDQPLFTHVHDFMVKNNYQLMDYGNILHVKSKNTKGVGGAKSNMVSGDALYFKKIDCVANDILNSNEKLHPIMAICAAYGYNDYAIEICLYLQKSTSNMTEQLSEYIDLLTKSQSILRRLINKINFSDRKIRKYSRLTGKLIPVKHASWIPGLGND